MASATHTTTGATPDAVVPSVIVRQLKILNTGTSLRALATIKYGETTVHDCKIVQRGNDEPWVSSPQQSYQANGQTKYNQTIHWELPLYEAITHAVLQAYKAAGGRWVGDE